MAAILVAAFLFQGTWALAGVTGGISGYVHDDTGAPVVGARVTAMSPSQTARATTDSRGHFVFLTLAPDTYSLTVEKTGYQTVTQAGLTVFADQVQTVALVAPRALKVIATAHTTASALVKPGVGGDLYNVTPSQMQASAALGGGGNLNTAYSAIASVPGVVVPTGGMGWQQNVVIHGENPYTTGDEYDGVPINRAFDQYISNNFSNLGLQELQVYTGGGPVNIASSGISGFINSVIKTGTYPGYANLTGGIAGPAFYHEAQFEAGGATPDRNFSYYVGIGGYDQVVNSIDNSDGASYTAPGGELDYSGYNNPFLYANGSADYGYAVAGRCTNFNGWGLPYFFGAPGSENPASASAACLMSDGSFPGYSQSDREDVVNLHFGIPRRDGQRDDIQALWSAGDIKEWFGGYNGAAPDDQLGSSMMTLMASGLPYSTNPNFNPVMSALGLPGSACAPYCANYPYYNDSTVYNVPFGTIVNPGTGVTGTPYLTYWFPDSPTGRAFGSQLPENVGDNTWNDNDIVKLQWTHPFSENAYLRVFAYSMYTDWNQVGPDSSYEYDFGPDSPLADDYLLTTHTTGGELQLADQINDQNLVNVTANYVTAGTSRWYNSGFVSGAFASPLFCGGPMQECTSQQQVGLIALNGGRYTCYSISTMAQTSCATGDYTDTAYDNAVNGEPAITGAAATAGAHYENVWSYDASAENNTVKPAFYNVNFSDEWRPNDKWVIDAAIRYDNYDYLMQSSQNAANEFYVQVLQDYSCLNPTTDTPLLTPLKPGTPPPPGLEYTSTCPAGYVHPDGIGGDPLFSDYSPPHYDIADWSARFHATYNSDPNTVWRISAGRFVEPPLTASLQYVNASGNNLGQWGTFMQFGYLSPFHPSDAESSAQYDFSWEHHFPSTNLSMKVTPFYETASNWQQQYFIGPGYVTQIPVGEFRSYGVEAEAQWGDFAANGLSGLISFAYTNAAVQYKSLLGESAVKQLNTAIEAYDCLTHSYYSSNTGFCNANFPSLAAAGGASPCYTGGVASACSGALTDTVSNPYYAAAPQPTMDPNGWWPDPAATGSGLFLGPSYNDAEGFAVPYTATVVLNYRVNRLAITPSVQWDSGSSYGSPMDLEGIDPVACSTTGTNQGAALNPSNPFACNYLSYTGGSISPWGALFIPNPDTGKFASYGAYTEPSILIANLQLTYDVSPMVRLTLTAADLYHTCFGGSNEAWTTAEPPSAVICGYDSNSLDWVGGPVGGGAYLGSSPMDVAANGVKPESWELQPYLGQAFTPGDANSYNPFTLYFQVQIHI